MEKREEKNEALEAMAVVRSWIAHGGRTPIASIDAIEAALDAYAGSVQREAELKAEIDRLSRTCGVCRTTWPYPVQVPCERCMTCDAQSIAFLTGNARSEGRLAGIAEERESCARECEAHVPKARFDAWNARPQLGAVVDQTSALVLAVRIRARTIVRG